MIENMSDNIYLKQINFCYQKGILSRDILRSIFDLIHKKKLKVDIYLPSYNNDIDLVIQNIQSQQRNLQINQQINIQQQNQKNIQKKNIRQRKQITIENKTITEVYNELKNNYNKIQIIILDSITNNLNFLEMRKGFSLLDLIKRILKDKNIEEIYISNSNIFPKNEVRFYETNKKVISIDNCKIRNIIINTNDINIDTLILREYPLMDTAKSLLKKLKEDEKIKNLIIE